jgi:hypothetical protein
MMKVRQGSDMGQMPCMNGLNASRGEASREDIAGLVTEVLRNAERPLGNT